MGANPTFFEYPKVIVAIVPDARYFRNPVPNEVRCGVTPTNCIKRAEGTLLSVVVACLRHAYALAPSPTPHSKAVQGYEESVLSARRQEANYQPNGSANALPLIQTQDVL